MVGLPTFDYDPKEGLDDFLTPVYFHREVLIKYVYDARVSFQFASETYGTIFLEDAHISFGINPDDFVFVWLGDLLDLPLIEQYHWLGNNVSAKHDMRSEFYEAQINATFTEPPLGVRLLNALDELNQRIAKIHGIAIYKPRSFEDRRHEVQRYRKIVINREDDFIRYISELNEIVNENTDNDAIRASLKENGVKFQSGMKGNKLLELFYRDVIGDSNNLIAPFFYLYDLRLWADHNLDDEKLNFVSEKLGVGDASDFHQILTKLLTHLTFSAKKLDDLLPK